tara:strand:+ start:3015 stop:3518 length:504 start_codon:yes stop_codon:yes gene_type:complete
MASRRTPIVILNLIKSFGKSFFDISQIDDNLFLSGEYKENDLMSIHKLGIKCVIDMRSETIFDGQKFNDLGIEYHNIPVDNFYPPDDNKTLFGIEIIKKHINSNQKILVHCKEGVGRSPYIIAGYLITQGYSVYESLSLIKSKRWGVNLNKIQRKSIKQFYEKMVFD